jgi:iron uptake system EfeUOB component EfeO/EfeM
VSFRAGATLIGVGACLALVVGCGSRDPRPSAAAARYSRSVLAARGPSTKLVDRPIPARLFRGPIASYRRYAESVAARLRSDTHALERAIDSGDRGAAEAAWRVAFARYLSLGAVYGEFGKLDTAIDGEAGGLPRGVDDPRFTGLHRLEYGLWTDISLRRLAPVAVHLAKNVKRLSGVIPRASLPPADYVTRGHEILEDAQRDFLSGTAVPWSGEGVLATRASLGATRTVVTSLKPLMGANLYATISARLATLKRTLDSIQADHGGQLPTLGGLTRRERERVDGAIAGALEELQELPELETTVPPPAPQLTP